MRNELTHLIDSQAVKHPERAALHLRSHEGNWAPLSWRELQAVVDDAAAALEILDIAEGDMIAIFSANRAEVIMTDFAAYANRAVPVSIYSTSSAEQVSYILNDSRASVIFVGTRELFDIVRSIAADCPALRLIVTYDPVIAANTDRNVMSWAELVELGKNASQGTRDEVARRTADATPDDLATLIYTSGTTGEPKGAMLTHANFDAAMEIHRERLTMLSDQDTSLCFLPLCHIFEKAWTYFCLTQSIMVYVNEDPKEVTRSLREVRPTCMCSVPRVWEKAYTAIQDKIARMNSFRRLMVKAALKVGRKYNLEYAMQGQRAPFFTRTAYRFFDKKVFAPVRRAMGVDRGNIYPTAGAPISKEICEFFHVIGVNLVIGYGLSETTATVTCAPIVGYEFGSVGTLMPRLEVRIGDENEILVKGPTVMRGYYNKPDQTAEAFTPDGFFRTGDAGLFDASGALVLTDRIKDLFKTSNGKYIAPQVLESRLGQDRYIEQVAVIGESRKYVTAIIIPAFEAIKEYAAKKKIAYRNMEDLVRNSEIVKLISSRVDKLQQGLAGFEKIKRFTLLPREFTMESGELTNTLKLRRPVINSHYAGIINAMYT